MGIIVYKLGICSCTWSYPRVSLLFHRGIEAYLMVFVFTCIDQKKEDPNCLRLD
jgi:hypothetical protein